MLQNRQEDGKDSGDWFRELKNEAAKQDHLPRTDIYEARGKPTTLPRRANRRFTAIPRYLMRKREGAPCRLVKARHHVAVHHGNDIFPGQVCVAVESEGKGKGTPYEGLHAVRARLPDKERRELLVARVGFIGGGYHLMWEDRENVKLPLDEVTFVGNIVGCYSNDQRIAPFLTMFSN